jgi:hypothetical protein
MQELSRMKEILDLLGDCDCPDLDACGAAAAAHPGRRRDTPDGSRDAGGLGA